LTKQQSLGLTKQFEMRKFAVFYALSITLASASGTTTAAATTTTVMPGTTAASKATTTNVAKGKSVQQTVTISGLDFAKVEKNAAFKAALISAVKKAFVNVVGATYNRKESDIAVTLKAGSVKATVVVTPPAEDKTLAMKEKLLANKASIGAEIDTALKQETDIEKVLKDGKKKTDVKSEAHTPTLVAGGPTKSGNAAVVSAAREVSLVAVVALLGFGLC